MFPFTPPTGRTFRLWLFAGLCSTTCAVGAEVLPASLEAPNVRTPGASRPTELEPIPEAPRSILPTVPPEDTAATPAPPSVEAPAETTPTVEVRPEVQPASSGTPPEKVAESPSQAKPPTDAEPLPHGLVAVPISERLQAIQNDETEDELLYESSAQVDPAAIVRAVDEAFAERSRDAGDVPSEAIEGQAAEAAGRVTAELLAEAPADPLDIALFAVPPEPTDPIFLAARRAFDDGDLEALRAQSALLENHPLGAYLELWILRLELQADPDDPAVNLRFQDFIDTHQGDYVGERAAADYLILSGRRINAKLFDSIDERLLWNRQDPDIAAWRLYYRLGVRPHDRKTLNDAKALYADARATHEAYQLLGDLVATQERSWAWDRVILLLQKGEWEEVKRVLSFVPRPELPAPITTLGEVLDHPVLWFNRHKESLAGAPARLGVFAALRLAHAQPALAAQCTELIEERLATFWRSLLWSVIGYQGTTGLNPDGVLWYARAGSALSQRPLLVHNLRSVLAWNARSALRAGNWHSLDRLIDRMPHAQREEEVWIYWKARALQARGQRTAARQLFERIAGNVSFYGKLSCDALGRNYAFERRHSAAPANKTPPLWEENASLQRAAAFYRLDLYREGHREWNWAMRGLHGADFVSLAEFAKSKLLIHRMINTSERSGKELVSIEQRYPMPHAQLINRVSVAQQIPSAWVYGLIRQESRFIPSVSSSVGARGLMQVMPQTAQWIAAKLGIDGYEHALLTELEMNLVLGSAYLRMLYADFDSSYVFATAAYNAGPARARVWRRTLREPMEAAVFIETIPFHETRDYVKNVLSNMQTYSMRTESPIGNFSRFLGRVHPGTSPYSDLP